MSEKEIAFRVTGRLSFDYQIIIQGALFSKTRLCYIVLCTRSRVCVPTHDQPQYLEVQNHQLIQIALPSPALGSNS